MEIFSDKKECQSNVTENFSNFTGVGRTVSLLDDQILLVGSVFLVGLAVGPKILVELLIWQGGEKQDEGTGPGVEQLENRVVVQSLQVRFPG